MDNDTVMPCGPREANEKLAPIEVHVGRIMQTKEARNCQTLRRCVRDCIRQPNGTKELSAGEHNVAR